MIFVTHCPTASSFLMIGRRASKMPVVYRKSLLRQKRLLGEAVKKYVKDRKVRAVFVGGSLARGTANKFSDVDLVLVTKKPRAYVRYHHKGIHLEVDSLTLPELKQRLQNRPIDYYSFRDIKALHDPEVLLLRIQRVLKNFVRQYKAPMLAKADLYIQLFHYQAKFRSAALLGKPALGNILSLEAAPRCFEALALINNVIPPPLKGFREVAKKFRIKPAGLDRMIGKVVSGSAKERVAACSSLINFLLPKLESAIKKFTKFYRPWTN